LGGHFFACPFIAAIGFANFIFLATPVCTHTTTSHSSPARNAGEESAVQLILAISQQNRPNRPSERSGAVEESLFDRSRQPAPNHHFAR
jgi:hypothetical protein